MDRFSFVSGDVLRLTSLMAIGIGIAWALQSLGFGLTWVLGAAAIAGAGTGLVCASEAVTKAHAPAPIRKRPQQ